MNENIPKPVESPILVEGLTPINVSATAQALTLKAEFLAEAIGVFAVTDSVAASHANSIQRAITLFIRGIEAAREQAKAPLLSYGRRIDQLAKNLTTDLDAEAKRLGRLLGEYSAGEERKAEDARRKAYEDEQRVKREAFAAQQAIALKAQEEAAELARKAARARSEQKAEEYRQAEAALKKQAAIDTLLAQQKASLELTTIVQQAVPIAPPKFTGSTLRREVAFEVTDIVALYSALPGMVLLSPNKAAIKAQLKTLPEGQSLPGVKHWWENSSSIRS